MVAIPMLKKRWCLWCNNHIETRF